MKTLSSLSIIAALLVASPGRAADIKTPEEQFKSYPNRLADIPPNWATTNPIRLQVCFNLKAPVNSPEADAFLADWYRSIKAMPYGVELRMERVVFPVRFAYCGSLIFKDWRTNREYEASEVFLKYYRERWKPAVTETSEQMTILDTVATER